ncbi:basic proline-rich protein-like [Phalacrocorax carbo]|uniref:basic proline-rich protein-like n=1 Tax=Phalacrocorax carbo TaxID=9209 RepID=UPI003119CA12
MSRAVTSTQFFNTSRYSLKRRVYVSAEPEQATGARRLPTLAPQQFTPVLAPPFPSSPSTAPSAGKAARRGPPAEHPRLRGTRPTRGAAALRGQGVGGREHRPEPKLPDVAAGAPGEARPFTGFYPLPVVIFLTRGWESPAEAPHPPSAAPCALPPRWGHPRQRPRNRRGPAGDPPVRGGGSARRRRTAAAAVPRPPPPLPLPSPGPAAPFPLPAAPSPEAAAASPAAPLPPAPAPPPPPHVTHTYPPNLPLTSAPHFRRRHFLPPRCRVSFRVRAARAALWEGTSLPLLLPPPRPAASPSPPPRMRRGCLPSSSPAAPEPQQPEQRQQLTMRRSAGGGGGGGGVHYLYR